MTNMAAAASGGDTCPAAVPRAAHSQSLGGGGGRGQESGLPARRAQEYWLAPGSGLPRSGFGCLYSGEGLAAAAGLGDRSGQVWGPIKCKGQTNEAGMPSALGVLGAV